MLDLRIKAGRRSLPIFDLPALLGRQEAMRELGDQIDGLIAFLDDLTGDPDVEEDDDGATHEDAGERCAWIEAVDQSHLGKHATADIRDHEDAEEDDPGGTADRDDDLSDWGQRYSTNGKMSGDFSKDCIDTEPRYVPATLNLRHIAGEAE